MKLVVIESPFAGDVAKNIAYARRAMADSIARGESPYASHLLFTQPGILDDTRQSERDRGIALGFAWGRHADLTAVYADLGISAGMRLGIERALADGRPWETRYLDRRDA